MRNSSVCVFRDTYANYILWTICAHVCELSGINRDIENPIISIFLNILPTCKFCCLGNVFSVLAFLLVIHCVYMVKSTIKHILRDHPWD